MVNNEMYFFCITYSKPRSISNTKLEGSRSIYSPQTSSKLFAELYFMSDIERRMRKTIAERFALSVPAIKSMIHDSTTHIIAIREGCCENISAIARVNCARDIPNIELT